MIVNTMVVKGAFESGRKPTSLSSKAAGIDLEIIIGGFAVLLLDVLHNDLVGRIARTGSKVPPPAQVCRSQNVRLGALSPIILRDDLPLSDWASRLAERWGGTETKT